MRSGSPPRMTSWPPMRSEPTRPPSSGRRVARTSPASSTSPEPSRLPAEPLAIEPRPFDAHGDHPEAAQPLDGRRPGDGPGGDLEAGRVGTLERRGGDRLPLDRDRATTEA